MNALDFAIIAVIALSAIFAFARGFVREALSIAAWVGAAAIALYGFNNVYAIIVRFVTTPLLADLIAGAGLFVVSLIVLTVLTGYVARFVDGSALSPIDRTLGLIFGLVRGLVLVSLAYLVVDVSLPQNDRPPWMKEAKSERFLAKGRTFCGMLCLHRCKSRAPVRATKLTEVPIPRRMRGVRCVRCPALRPRQRFNPMRPWRQATTVATAETWIA